ncbi:UNVERIFIED_CONTAM: hypothetical protein HDU68_003391 [Siphonaria sp. JEL0065]|nr:hypothetical protein HDU68_003391 [Siphonaria sp. JEL0065]
MIHTNAVIPSDLELFFLEIEAELQVDRVRREKQELHDQIVAEMRRELGLHTQTPMTRCRTRQARPPQTVPSPSLSESTATRPSLASTPILRDQVSPYRRHSRRKTSGPIIVGTVHSSGSPSGSPLDVVACRNEIRYILSTQRPAVTAVTSRVADQ